MPSPNDGGSAYGLSNGVFFPIRDQNADHIFCRVTYEALAELDGCDPNMPPETALEIFQTHRAEIENQAKELNKRGVRVVVVTPALVASKGNPRSRGDSGEHTGA